VKSPSVKVALIGAGSMAREHARAFTDAEQVTLSGIYSRTRARAERVARDYNIAATCNSIEELYLRTRAHLVVIAVSELSTRAVCEEAFHYPWVCLIEKPAGYNLIEAKAISRNAKFHKRMAFVGLNRRHYRSTRMVLEEAENMAGPRLIHVYDQEDPAFALKSGRPREVVDNWMYANSIHTVDYLRVFGRGDITSVEPVEVWQQKNPWIVIAKIFFSSGDIGVYEAVWNAPGPWAVSVTTRAKRWEMRPLEHATVQSYGSRTPMELPGHMWDTQFKPGIRLQAEEALRCVRGQNHKLPTLHDAFESMVLIHKIYGQ
jgi:predicted dehydrogenase